MSSPERGERVVSYAVDGLQAVEPAELAKEDGITVRISPELDSMGFSEVEVEAETKEQLLDYVAREWGVRDGDEVVGDIDWFNEYVVARVREVGTPRTILVHLNATVPFDDPRPADEIIAYIEAALTVGLEGGPDDRPLDVVVALAEEI